MFRLLILSALTAPSFAYAQSATPAGPPMWAQLVPFAVAIIVMMVFTSYTQKKKQSERDSSLSKLERGNEVLTTSGILGRIEGLTDLYITLEIAPNTRIKVLRSAIAGLAKNVSAAATEVKS